MSNAAFNSGSDFFRHLMNPGQSASLSDYFKRFMQSAPQPVSPQDMKWPNQGEGFQEGPPVPSAHDNLSASPDQFEAMVSELAQREGQNSDGPEAESGASMGRNPQDVARQAAQGGPSSAPSNPSVPSGLPPSYMNQPAGANPLAMAQGPANPAMARVPPVPRTAAPVPGMMNTPLGSGAGPTATQPVSGAGPQVGSAEMPVLIALIKKLMSGNTGGAFNPSLGRNTGSMYGDNP